MNEINAKGIYAIAGISILICIGSFALNFHAAPISNNPEGWGQLGDYVGGLLNPVAAILNVFVTIQIAKSVNNFSKNQIQQQFTAQKELVKTQLLYEILKDFKIDILSAASSIKTSLDEGSHPKLKAAVENGRIAMDAFIKYHQSLFSFPPGIALGIVTDYNQWLVPLGQGLLDTDGYKKLAEKNKLEIDLMLSLLYGSIIDEAKHPEKKTITPEILAEWEKRLTVKVPETK